MSETLAQRLQRARKEQGFTVAALAAACMASEGAIRQLEDGKVKSPAFQLGLRLADVLHIDPYALAFGDGGSITQHLTMLDRRVAALEARAKQTR